MNTPMRGPSPEASGHTPGPWQLRYRTTNQLSVLFPDGTAFHEWARNFDLRDVADARLIAAAPDMLAALQLFVKQWEACGPNSDFGRYFKNVRDTAVYVLAKAVQS